MEGAVMKTATQPMRDSYFDLVRQFPLVPVRSEKQYDAAVAFLTPLAVRDENRLDSGEKAHLAALSQFVEDYERDRHRIDTADLSPLETLKYLMRQNAMRPVDLGGIFGSRSLASQVLNGKRELSKAHILALAEHFRVAPGLFIR